MSVNIYKDDELITVAGSALGGGSATDTFKGTMAEWEALSKAEKDKYIGKEVIITDDYNSNICNTVAECVASTNVNDVAGASAVKEVQTEIDGLSNTLGNVNKRYSQKRVIQSNEFAKNYSDTTNPKSVTIVDDGIAYISYKFNVTQYSQFNVFINNVGIVPSMITRGDSEGVLPISILTIPVQKGDVISVSFYSTFGMADISMRVIGN